MISNSTPKRKALIHRREILEAGTVGAGWPAHCQHESNWSSSLSPHFGHVHIADPRIAIANLSRTMQT
jgi:hypothetical protein